MSEVFEGFRWCDDCAEHYSSASRTCPMCGGQRTEYDIA